MISTSNLLLLDTHVWAHLATGQQGKFSTHALKVLERGFSANSVRVSAISVWEVAMLSKKGKIRLSPDPSSWLRRALDLPGLQLIDLPAEAALEAALLPDNISADPADRFLVALARFNGMTLVTKDLNLLEYGAAGYLKVLDASA